MKFMLDVPTLERLIGGDTEIELGLKQAAASEFAKRYMGNVVNEEVLKEIVNLKIKVDKQVNQVAIQELDKYKQKLDWYSSNYTLDAKFKEEIRKVVKDTISETISQIVREISASTDFKGIAKEQVDRVALYEAKEAAKNEIKALLK